MDKSVFRIAITSETKDYVHPWLTSRTAGGHGSCFAIKYKGEVYFVTNAHVVKDAVALDIDYNGDMISVDVAKKVYDCDLAIVKPRDAKFAVKPLNLAFDVKKDDTVTVVGFPRGGRNISSTNGTITRIETSYTYFRPHISIHMDATGDFGNSGGPVLRDGRVVAVLNAGTDKESKAIPASYIAGIIDNPNVYTPKLALELLPMSSQGLKRLYGADGGVLIREVCRDEMNRNNMPFEVDDVLVSINGASIRPDGLVSAYGDVVSLGGYVSTFAPESLIPVEYVRNGAKCKASTRFPLRTTPLDIDPRAEPKYAILYGVCFVAANEFMVRQVITPQDEPLFTRSCALDLTLYTRFTDHSDEFGVQECIVVTDLIQCEKTRHSVFDYYTRLLSVNGQKVHNIRHLVSICGSEVSSGFLKFEFAHDGLVVVDTSDVTTCAEYNTEVCRKMGIAKYTNVL